MVFYTFSERIFWPPEVCFMSSSRPTSFPHKIVGIYRLKGDKYFKIPEVPTIF